MEEQAELKNINAITREMEEQSKEHVIGEH